MARPKKNTIDYFPHDCVADKTVKIINAHFGNEGYAFYYKLFELLGRSENHFLHCGTEIDWQYLCTELSVESDKAERIIEFMVDLEIMNRSFWEEHKIIWSPAFCRMTETVYQKWKRPVPEPTVANKFDANQYVERTESGENEYYED